ncbi:MAG: hypothetical protein QGH74_01290 [Candidatus Brocadiia bacterium]|nr:hypothetical protein [Candidatus Brocadiia bacterium]
MRSILRGNVTRFALLAGLAALGTFAGCRGGENVQVENPAGYRNMPGGPLAVLEVTARPLEVSRAFGPGWSIVRNPAELGLVAEALAHMARVEGGLDVMEPREVRRRLKKAKLEPTYGPSAEQIAAFAGELGIACYLSAHIEELYFGYVVSRTKGVARLVVACRAPGVEEPLWLVRTEHTAWEIDERQATAAALRQAFRTLNALASRETGGRPEDADAGY